MSRNLKVGLVFAAVFLAGAIAGGFATYRFAPPPKPPRQNLAEKFSIGQMKRLTDRLELTDEQRASIKPILSRTGTELRAIRIEGFHETSALLDRMGKEVEKVLTEDQKKQFAIVQTEERERMKELTADRNRHDGRSPGNKDEPPPPSKKGE